MVLIVVVALGGCAAPLSSGPPTANVGVTARLEAGDELGMLLAEEARRTTATPYAAARSPQ